MQLVGFVALAVAALSATGANAAQVNVTNPGVCTTPAVRHEWRTLSDADKKAYLDAVKCLATLPHLTTVAPDGSEPDVPTENVTSNFYDDHVFAHNDGVLRNHFTGVFLSWHRFFLRTYENNLQQHCGFNGTVPYWDWTLDVDNITASPLFTPDPNTGFGTFSNDSASNFSVTDGAFGNTERAYPTPHLVGRHFRPQPFLDTTIFPFPFNKPNMLATTSLRPLEVDFITTHFVGNYTNFQAYMDGVAGINGRAEGMHNAGHLMLLGDMANIGHSPNDPVFFSHHANLDRIWANWQAFDPANANATGGGLVQNLTDYDTWPAGSPPFVTGNEQLQYSGLTIGPQLHQVLNTTGGLLCYVYADPPKVRNHTGDYW